MKRFLNENEMAKNMMLDKQETRFLMDEIGSWVGCIGSEIVKSPYEEPARTFKFEVFNKVFEIGVTAVKLFDDEFKNYFWCKEIQ